MKKIMKIAASLLLAVAMLIPSGLVFAAEPVDFTDVDPDDWFAPYVDYCSKNGLVNGMAATTFEPDTALSRAMFVTILYRSTVLARPSEGAEMPFTDVPESHWAKDAILWAYENQIVNGMTPTKFQPDGKITREQMCTILCRFAPSMGYALPSPEEAEIFLDDYMISPYAYDYVYSCAAAGIVNGMTEFTFEPQANATRAQACAILKRFFRYATSSVIEGERDGDMIPLEYVDKFGVYATGYKKVDGDGNITKTRYEESDSSGVYWEENEYTYADGRLVKSVYADSDGNEDELNYEYYEDGALFRVTRVKDGRTVSFTVDEYSDGNEFIEQYTITEDETSSWVTQSFKDGKLSKVVFRGGENVNQSLRYNYDENGDVCQIFFTDTERTISVLEGDFANVEGMVLPTKMTFAAGDLAETMGFKGSLLDITFDYDKLTVTVVDNFDYVPREFDMNMDDVGVTLFVIAVLLTEAGDMYEVVTPDNYMELLA